MYNNNDFRFWTRCAFDDFSKRGPCKKLVYVPTVKISCDCAGVLPAMCPGSWKNLDGYYTCSSPGDLRVCENKYVKIGDTFSCSQSYDWVLILSCALGSAACYITCTTATAGVGMVPCLACISVFGAKCVGCKVVVCTAGTVGDRVMGNMMEKNGGYCPPGTTLW